MSVSHFEIHFNISFSDFSWCILLHYENNIWHRNSLLCLWPHLWLFLMKTGHCFCYWIKDFSPVKSSSTPLTTPLPKDHWYQEPRTLALQRLSPLLALNSYTKTSPMSFLNPSSRHLWLCVHSKVEFKLHRIAPKPDVGKKAFLMTSKLFWRRLGYVHIEDRDFFSWLENFNKGHNYARLGGMRQVKCEENHKVTYGLVAAFTNAL